MNASVLITVLLAVFITGVQSAKTTASGNGTTASPNAGTIACSANMRCRGSAVCSMVACTCPTGYVYTGNNICSPATACLSYQVQVNGLCYNTVSFGMQCQFTQQCLGGAYCPFGTCQCYSGSAFNGNACIQQTGASYCSNYQVQVNGLCYNMVSFGMQCQYTQQCQSGSYCLSGSCQCYSGTTFNGNSCGVVQQLPSPVSCTTYQVSVNGLCLNMVSVGMQCQSTQQCQGGSYCPSGICQCYSGSTFNGNSCAQQQSAPISCSTNQVLLSGQCYSMVSYGMPCQFAQQCQGGTYCLSGTCQCYSGYTFNGNACGQAISVSMPTCNSASMTVQMNGGAAVNCLTQACAQGYACQWSTISAQYICCGGTANFNQAVVATGQVKLYFGSNLPVQCFNINDCASVAGYTNCVRSASRGYNVCCSTNSCA